jgi:hypothetical protein
VTEYPRLLRTFQEMVARLSSSLSTIPDAEDTMLQAILPFEKQYIFQTFSKIVDPINACIATSSQQQQPGIVASQAKATSPIAPNCGETLQAVAKSLGAELEAAKSNPRLVDAVSKQVVARAIRHIVARAEPLVSQAELDVRDKMTPQQLQNAVVFQVLVTAHIAFVALAGPGTWLPASSAEAINAACAAAEALATSCVSKLFANAAKLLEASIYLIHSEDFGGDSLAPKAGPGDDQQTSAYVTALDKQLRNF